MIVSVKGKLGQKRRRKEAKQNDEKENKKEDNMYGEEGKEEIRKKSID